jgi:dipeptidyl aminopeptidase/acylaminoacyl peptidase
MLAERAARDFLQRLEGGEAASAFRLHLTDRARAGQTAQVLSTSTGTDSQIQNATLLGFRRSTAASYEARVLLRWAGTDSGGSVIQTMTLRFALQRGLWLIDDISFGDRQASTPTPTRRPSTSQPVSRLEGRLVFQVSSGGDIYVINADGTGLRRLADGLDPAWAPSPPGGSTGKDRIAFARWRAPWGIYVINPDGSGEERVVDGNRIKEIAWSPDASRITFAINYGSTEPMEICFFGFCLSIPAFSTGQIWTANLITGELLSLPLDDGTVHAPTWSLTGERIVYAGDRGLAWIDLDSMETGRFGGGSVWDTSPAFSPNGRQIVFMGRVHDRWEIFLMNAGGSGRKQLTHGVSEAEGSSSNVAPAWSPDGRQIAFLSNRDGPWRIYVMGADGSQQRSLFGNRLDRLGIRYEWASERVISWSH